MEVFKIDEEEVLRYGEYLVDEKLVDEAFYEENCIYNSGDVILYNKNDEIICRIPYRDLKVLRPIKTTIKKER